MSERPTAPGRAEFALFRPIQTRWSDNDVYAHVNNVVYYSYFDTAVNGWLLEAGLLDIARSREIFLVVGTRCDYFGSVAFPDALEAGIAVTKLGTSSVTYRIGIFRAGEPLAVAAGSFIHVLVDRETQRPVRMAPEMRSALSGLIPGPETASC